MKHVVAAVLIGWFSLGSHAAAQAQERGSSNALFALDGLSFVSDAFANGNQVPISTIPVRVSQESLASWSFVVEPSALQLPPIELANGEKVRWALVEKAVGRINMNDSHAEVALSAIFRAESLSSSRFVDHRLEFTSESATAKNLNHTVYREGVKFDPRSGYVQLVAAGVDPPKSDHGIPFFVVLSGRIVFDSDDLQKGD